MKCSEHESRNDNESQIGMVAAGTGRLRSMWVWKEKLSESRNSYLASDSQSHLESRIMWMTMHITYVNKQGKTSGDSITIISYGI